MSGSGRTLEAIGNAFLFPAVDPQQAVRVRGVHPWSA